MLPTKVKILISLVILLLSVTVYSQDEEEKKLGWFFDAKLVGIWTGGNSESVTFGLGTTFKRIWDNSELRFDASGTQTESNITIRTAVGTSSNFKVRERTTTEKTAEILSARVRYDYNLLERLYALGGVSWLRNRFAGIPKAVS